MNSLPRSRQSIILRHIGHNLWTRMRHSFGRQDDYSGTMATDAARRAGHARYVFDRYLTLGGNPALDGASVLELGPGDSLAVGLLFAAAGASRVVCLDKFRYHHDNQPFFDALGIPPSLAGRVKAQCGSSIEEAGLEPESFDVIVSNAVLEEVPNLGIALAAMGRVLRPGGIMLHQVDLSDYHMFEGKGFHPLEFLTIPDPFWRAMTDSCGGPNRQPLEFYSGKLNALGLQTDLLITDDYVTGKRATPSRDLPAPPPNWLGPVRNRLLPRYRAIPDSELAVYGAFVKASKPK